MEEINPSTAANPEFVISRVFDAPRELVWDAMTNPEHVVHWWGPKGFTNTLETMDFRVGGVWNHVMHGPDGTDYPNSSTFTAIVKPERIEYSHGGGRKGDPDAQFDAMWTFEVAGMQTKVTLRAIFPTAEARNIVVAKYGAIEGAKQTLARLAEYLPNMEPDQAEFFITRTFDAPRELVWRAWTEPAQLAQWWGPSQITNPVCEMDLRPGGSYRIVMRLPDGTDYPIKGVFIEIAPPERLVMTLDCSEHPDEWHDLVKPDRSKEERNPAGEMVQTTLFENLGEKTRLTLRTRFNSAEIRNAMVKMGMTEGWSQSLDRLAGILGLRKR